MSNCESRGREMDSRVCIRLSAELANSLTRSDLITYFQRSQPLGANFYLTNIAFESEFPRLLVIRVHVQRYSVELPAEVYQESAS